MSKISVLSAVLLVLSIFCGSIIAAEDATASTQAKIAYESKENGNWDIYVMNADGSNRIRVTSNKEDELNSIWAPDGKKLLFEKHYGYMTNIYLINADGSGLMRLTNGLGDDYGPVWSPDGNWIAYTATTALADKSEVTIMNADGTSKRPLANGFIDIHGPSWSPDGRWIVFNRYQFLSYLPPLGIEAIYRIKADGTNLGKLVEGGDSACWSPRGDIIMYHSGLSIRAITADGTYLADVMPIETNVLSTPKWSPAGNRLARLGKHQIVISTYIGGEPQENRSSAEPNIPWLDKIGPDIAGRCFTPPVYEPLPFETYGELSWSPDGTMIALTKWLGQGKYRIYLYDLRDRRLIELPGGGTAERNPVWQPAGR